MWHLAFSQMGHVYSKNPYHPAGMAPQKRAAPPLRPITHPQECCSCKQSWWPDEGWEGQAAPSQSFCVGSESLPPGGVWDASSLWTERTLHGAAQTLSQRRNVAAMEPLGEEAVTRSPGLKGQRAIPVPDGWTK